MKRSFWFFPLLVSLFFLLFLAGCWNPFKPDTGPGDGTPTEELLPRSTPQNVLHNLRVIYGGMDNNLNTPEDAHTLALKYRDLFDLQFKFYFVQGQEPAIAPEGWWGTNDEVDGFDTLMTKRALGIVNEIQLTWSPGAAVPDNRVSETPPYGPLHPGWLWIHVTSVLLDVVQGPNVLRVSNGLAEFYFAPDPADTTKWVITEWRDIQIQTP
jgi:hypothetical protein